MRIEKEEIKYILEGLANCHFDELCNENAESLIYDIVADDYEDFATGATKIVLIPEHAEYVIKIPFSHSLQDISEWDAELEEYVWDNFYQEFECAPFGGRWDYCCSEVEVYKMACEYNVAQYFLPIQHIGEFNGHPVYVQEKVEMYDRYMTTSHSYIDEKNARESCKSRNLDMFNTAWCTDFILTYGIDAFSDLHEFFDVIGLTDLHDGNIGYYHDVPVIVDYAGYYE